MSIGEDEIAVSPCDSENSDAIPSPTWERGVLEPG